MDYLLYIRGAERILIVISGLVSLILGYGLFRLTYTRGGRSEAEMTARGGGFELSMKNVWPGVFFAAFGMIILVASVLTKVTVPNGPGVAAATNAPMASYQGGGLPPEDSKTRALKAITAMDAVLAQEGTNTTPNRVAIMSALSAAQSGLIDVAYGQGSLDRFNDIASKAKVPAEFARVTEKDRLFYEDLRSVLQR